MVVEENYPVARTRVPLRISFGGGGTDVDPYASEYGGVTLSATISKYVYCSVTRLLGEEIRVTSEDSNAASAFHMLDIPSYDGNLDLVKAVIARINPGWRRGLAVVVRSDAPPGSGLGASSAIVVAALLSIARVMGVTLSRTEVAHLAYEIERKDLGIMGGYQDQYAAAFGGFSWTEYRQGRVSVRGVGVESDILRELEYRSILWFTGEQHESGSILQDQVARYTMHDTATISRLEAMKIMAAEMRDAVLEGRLDEFGQLLHESWTIKRALTDKISSSRVDELYEAAQEAGAIGGKLLGAGGGGYLLLYVPEQVRRAMMSRLAQIGGSYGGQVHFDLSGPTTWASKGLTFPLGAFRIV